MTASDLSQRSNIIAIPRSIQRMDVLSVCTLSEAEALLVVIKPIEAYESLLCKNTLRTPVRSPLDMALRSSTVSLRSQIVPCGEDEQCRC